MTELGHETFLNSSLVSREDPTPRKLDLAHAKMPAL